MEAEKFNSDWSSSNNNSFENLESKIDDLSDRQKEIIIYIGEGYTPGEIYPRIKITKPTFDSHIRSIRYKLRVASMAILKKLAIAYDRTKRTK